MADGNSETRRGAASEVHRRQRTKNWAVLAVLLALVALVYVVAILRMKAGG
jgi:hypothetical protein